MIYISAIQRIKHRFIPPKYPTIGRSLDEICEYDYMGSSEFEFGALSDSLKKIINRKEEMVKTVFENIVDRDGKPLLVYGLLTNDEDIKEYNDKILFLVKNPYGGEYSPPDGGESLYMRLIEVIDINDHLKYVTRKDLNPGTIRYYRNRGKKIKNMLKNENMVRNDVWWDITNHVFMSFNPEFMKILPQAIENSRIKKLIKDGKMEAPRDDNEVEPNSNPEP